MEEFNPEDYAKVMANLFENNTRYFGGEVYVSDAGLNALGDYFQQVPYELRGPTFELFIEELNIRDIQYDAEQWKVG